MYNMTIELENRKEYVNFYGKWAAIQKAKDWGKCYDVRSLVVTDSDTGEIVIALDNQEIVWIDGVGEI